MSRHALSALPAAGPARPSSASIALVLLLVLSTVGGPMASALTLDGGPHIHGVEPDPDDVDRVLLATHAGLLAARRNGTVAQVSEIRHDLMALATDPSEPGRLVASGHPATGGNLGVIASVDGGRRWETLSPGVAGPVDFHALAVGAEGRMYGVHDGLQTSQDGGRTWAVVGPAPDGLFALAGSASDAQTLHAATRGGLLVSRDGGVSWSPAFPEPLPATAVLALADGSVLAFVVSRGLLRSDTAGTGWNEVDDRFGEQVLVDLAAHPASPTHLYGLNQFGRVISSIDGGATWLPFAGPSETRDPAALRGKALYETHCAACHGARGVGENWTSKALRDRAYIRAPALDDSTHAWHHTDAALKQTILEGSPREPRMRAWKDVLSERDAEEIVAYVKSLWGPRALDCQGPKHMQCM